MFKKMLKRLLLQISQKDYVCLATIKAENNLTNKDLGTEFINFIKNKYAK